MKKKYIKPEVIRIEIDNTISLVMMSHGNGNGHGHGHDKPPKPPKPKGAFDSPFGDSNFN
jgi:hypothetical protein